MDFFKTTALLNRIGKPPAALARTPAEVVYRENKLRVLRYLPVTQEVQAVPVVLVTSLINKYYILDLLPGKSYVEYLTAQGFAVYLIDWGVVDDADRDVTLEQYLDGYLARALETVRRREKARQVSLVGYCMGGTMSLLYAALHPRQVKNLILLATPVDFHNDSLLSVWVQPQYFDVDKFIDTYGNAPVSILQSTFMMLKPGKALTRYAELLAHADNEEFVEMFLAFDYWANDAVPVAGATFRRFVKDTFQANLLMQDKMMLGGRPVRLKAIKCPVLNVVAEHDNIVPPAASAPVNDLVGSRDVETLSVKGGHHGLTVGPGALRTVWPHTAQWLQARSGSRQRRDTA